MAEKKRQCGTCRFFVEREASGHGKCTHPLRAGTDADLLLLRPNELACRTKWGDSLWQDPADDSDPRKPQSPQQPTLPEPIAAQLQFDDEVTSVSIAGSKSSRSSFEDDVVDSGATATGMASWNDPVQDERLDLLRKSSHDALAGARKRHMEKQARQRELVPFATDEEPTETESAQETQQRSEPTESPVDHKPDFPPEDFVEEERSRVDSEQSFDDEMIDTGVSPERSRSPRLRKLLRDPNDPKTTEAMKLGVPGDMRVTSHNPEHREQWNSVPTLKPGVELPLNEPVERQTSAPVKVAASAAPIATTSHQIRPVSQARELLTEDRLRQERAQRQMVAPLVDEGRNQPPPLEVPKISNRPRLKEAVPQDSEPLEQIKSSPLRGYHPATRKLVQPSEDQEVQQERRPKPRASASPPRKQAALPGRVSPTTVDESPRQLSPSKIRKEAQNRQSMPQAGPASQSERKQSQRLKPVVQEQRRPYIPLHQENTPFVRLDIQIAPEVPRCCGTCASYRPSGVDGRGSCMNRFAGPVPRVVHEQDLGCQHTFGSLWLPANEEIWLKELPDYTTPTPRVDAMLARRGRREKTVLPDLEELTS